MPQDSDSYEAIKILMSGTAPKLMKAKYDPEGTGDDQGSRKMWPMILGHSKDPSDGKKKERALCYQITGSPEQRGWRCFKAEFLKDVAEENTNDDPPDPPDVDRQNCVVEPEIIAPRKRAK